MVYLKSVENVITLGKNDRPVVFILSPPPLHFVFKMNDLARPVMGTIFLVYIYLFYTSYSYNSIPRYAYRGISAHIPRRDLVIFCVLRSH